MKYRNLFPISCSTLLMLFYSTICFAETASFSWLAIDTTSVKGYKIHYGTASGSYTATVDVGSPKEKDGRVYATVDELASNKTYYFAATAYSSSDESDYSKEIRYTTPKSSSSGSTGQDDSSGSGGSGGSTGDSNTPSEPTDPVDDTTVNPPTLSSIELGTVQVGSEWKAVTFQESFTKPAVVAKVATINGSQPGQIRIRNITATGFEIRFQEWDYLDGSHTTESVNFIAMEKGVHQIDNQTTAVADCLELSGVEEFSAVSFAKPLARQPVVLASVTSDNGGDAVTLRMKAVSQSGFKIALQEQESNNDDHVVETGCFMAWEQSSGIVDSLMYEAMLTGNTLTDKKITAGFKQQHQSTPLTFAGMQTFNGADPAVLRQTTSGKQGVNLYVKEEQSEDQETTHTHETGGILALSPYQSPLTFESGEVDVTHKAVRIPFENNFSQPVVVARMVSKNDNDPGVLRIYDVDKQGFTIQVQEYEYLDGAHKEETVNYIVLEKGVYTLANGAVIEAGTFETDATDGSELQPLLGSFTTTPVLMTSVTTKNGSHTVTGRINTISTTGFKYLLQEQEANTDGHVVETVSYLAWEPGTGMVGSISYQVGKSADTLQHRPGTINYKQAFASTPIVLADMQSRDGDDTATLAVKSTLRTGLEVFIEEETSKDSETKHTSEVGGYIALSQE